MVSSVSVLPNEVWPCSLEYKENIVEVVDAQSVVHLVKMYLVCDYPLWNFSGEKWMEFISKFWDLKPKIIHFDQVGCSRFLVNFYTSDGVEVDYRFTKGHVQKYLVVGCEDPRMYQPIPRRMMFDMKVDVRSRSTSIKFKDVKSKVDISFSYFKKLKEFVGVAFTGVVWERICKDEMFSSSKVLVLSYDGGSRCFGGKVMHKCVTDWMIHISNWMIHSSSPGETSNAGGGLSKSFTVKYSMCVHNTGYLTIPAYFHGHKMRYLTREVWLNAGASNLYMAVKVHIDKRLKTDMDTKVELVGQMFRLKDVLKLEVGDGMFFELISGNLSSDDVMCFNVSKLV